ncbi:hypothetical protein GJAV_G00074410 [Gymnothorax javanicus]|nr:hypothetical protein GJAV_G00074410 [Gymnothorax javanicus]
MWNRPGTRSSALERAQAQLSGQRFFKRPIDRSTDELQVYMNALIKKKNTLHAGFKYDDLSGMSSNESESDHNKSMTSIAGERLLGSLEKPGGGEVSRFLKKGPSRAVTSSQSPTLTRAGVRNEEPRSVSSVRRSSQTAALSRLALIEDRFRNRYQAKKSLDTDAQAREETPPTVQSSRDPSEQGSRFLKKKTDSVAQQLELQPVKAGRLGAPQLRFSGQGVILDSDEEDMKKLLGSSLDSTDENLPKEVEHRTLESPNSAKKSYLKTNKKFTATQPSFTGRKTPSIVKSRSPSPPSRGTPRRGGFRAQSLRSPSYSLRSTSVVLSPTPSPPNISSSGRTSTPRVKFLRPSLSSVSVHSEVRSLDELFPGAPPSDDTVSEKSETSEEFKIKILSLDDLVPDTMGTIRKPKEEERTMGVSVQKPESPSLRLNEKLADNILKENERKIHLTEAEVEYESDFESEIYTEADRSVSEISECLGHGGREVSTASETQDGSRTAGFSSPSGSRRRTERSVSPLSQSELDRSDGSNSGSRRGSYAHLSTSASFSDTITPPRERHKVHKTVRETGVQAQLDGLSYAWTSGLAALGPSDGMSHVDPTPIASHVVSAEAVEALTAYSPAVLALNDMLRQQLALTRQMVETSRHLHTSLLESLGPANYTYTTLEDTKEFIQRHKSPPLTVEAALEEVLQEMREYHFI